MIAWYEGENGISTRVFSVKSAPPGRTTVPIVLICRSGNRSREAGEFLEQNGFSDVYNVLYGFEGELDDSHHRSTRNGWRYDGLPWEQC